MEEIKSISFLDIKHFLKISHDKTQSLYDC
jgi:hypothetical protein